MESFTNRSDSVLKLQIIPIYFLGKIPEILLTPLLSYSRVKSWKKEFFLLPMAITRQPKNENFRPKGTTRISDAYI